MASPELNKVLVYILVQWHNINESLMHRWIGPFTIVHAIKSNSYLLLLCDSSDQVTFADIARIDKP